MNGLTLKIIDGNNKALALAKTMITTPTLINTDIKQGALFSIPLKVETNQKSASAEVSESLVISTDVKQYISDNVAPGSKTWRLSGYIEGQPELEPTNFYKPFVQMYTDILWNWRDKGAVLVFKDGDARIYKRVVIKDLQTSQQKDCANACPFTLTLKEINVMETYVSDFIDTKLGNFGKLLKSLPAAGSILGAPVSFGMTVSKVNNSDQ